MKTLFSILCLYLAVACSAAEPAKPTGGVLLQLADGRKFEQWSVFKEGVTTITIRYKGGLSTLSKYDLPAELKTAYPIDENAAAEEAAKSAEGRAAWQQRVAANEAAARQAYALEQQAAAARAAARARTANRSTTRTQVDTARISPRRIVSEVSTVTVPPDSKALTHTVEFSAKGAISADIKFGKVGMLVEAPGANTAAGWRETVQARTGERVHFYTQASLSGGQPILLEIRVDGTLVATREIKGQQASADMSWTLR